MAPTTALLQRFRRAWSRVRLAACGAVALAAFALLAGAAQSRPQAADRTRPATPVAENMRALSSLRLPGTADLAFFDHGGSVGKVVYVGTTVNGSGCPKGVRIVDVSDLRHPRVVATAGGHSPAVYEDVEVRRVGDRVVLAVGLQPCGERPQGMAGVALYDVTVPSRPKQLGLWRSPRRGVHELDFVVRRDGRALVLAATPHSERDSIELGRSFGGDWRIIDVTDPRRPKQLSDWAIIRDSDIPAVGTDRPIANPYAGVGGYAVYYGHSVRGSDDGMTAYVSYWDAGVLKFDIRDPAHPRLLGRTAFGADEEGDAHSVALLERGGRHYILESHEEVDPRSPPRVTTSATAKRLPAIELSWAPTGLADTGALSAEIADAGGGCTAAAFAEVRDRIALVDQIDPSVPRAGTPRCDIGAQVVFAANAGAKALLVNVTTGTRATIFRFVPKSRPAVDAAARGMPVVAISTLDGGARDVRAQLRTGVRVTASLAPTQPRFGGLAIYDDGRRTAAPGAPVFTRVGRFDDVPGVVGDANRRPYYEGGAWYTSHNIEVRGARAFVSWYSGGIVAVDLSAAPKLRRVGEFSRPGALFWGVDVDPKGETVFGTDFGHLWVLQPTGAARG